MMWLYDIPTWPLAILIIGLTMAASLGGTFPSPAVSRRTHRGKQ